MTPESLRIVFSHQFLKIRLQDEAKLLAVDVVRREDIGVDAMVYDTAYFNARPGDPVLYYPLEPGEYLRLVLLGNRGIPFTTYRKNNPENRAKYVGQEGKTFTIYVNEEFKP